MKNIKKYLIYAGILLITILSAFLYGSWQGKLEGKKEQYKEKIKSLDDKSEKQNQVTKEKKKDYQDIRKKIKNSNINLNQKEIDKLVELSEKQHKKTDKLKAELDKIKEGEVSEENVDTEYLNDILNNS